MNNLAALTGSNEVNDPTANLRVSVPSMSTLLVSIDQRLAIIIDLFVNVYEGTTNMTILSVDVCTR